MQLTQAQKDELAKAVETLRPPMRELVRRHFELGPAAQGASPGAETSSSASADSKVNPSHYRTHPDGKEAIDVVVETLGTEGTIAFCRGNVIKYQRRAGMKPGAEKFSDLAKADWYAQFAAHLMFPESFEDPRSKRAIQPNKE